MAAHEQLRDAVEDDGIRNLPGKTLLATRISGLALRCVSQPVHANATWVTRRGRRFVSFTGAIIDADPVMSFSSSRPSGEVCGVEIGRGGGSCELMSRWLERV